MQVHCYRFVFTPELTIRYLLSRVRCISDMVCAMRSVVTQRGRGK